MLDRFQNHLASRALIPRDARILVGYSGGADSTCLLHLLVRSGFDVVAAHLHHGQRAEADDEMQRCEAFATSLDVPFASGKADVPRMASDLKVGLEEAGRQARYAFFDQAAYRTECQWIVTGHTRTDLVETVLLNLVRGSGMAGLSGIPERRGNIVRPLLPFMREETREYCLSNGFWFHDDPANEDASFSRARIRHRVLPELRSINPHADSAVARLAEIVSEEDGFLNGMAAAALEQSELPINGALQFLTRDVEAAFDRARLTGLPHVLFRRCIRLASEALGAPLDHHQTRTVSERVQTEPTGSVTADGGEVVVEWTLNQIGVREIRPTVPFRYPLTVPGETASDEFGWQFTAFEGEPSGTIPERISLEAEFDRSALRGPLYFRTVEPGDSMQPLGFDGHRKLSELMRERGLTAAARARLPIVCDLRGPLWAPGVCLDQRVRKSEQTQRCIAVRFEPISEYRSHNEETASDART